MLDHYTAAGLVDVTPLTLPDYQPNTAGLQHLYMEDRRRTTQLLQFELISLNDCLYRNMYSYEYIALLDIDEVIVPLKHTNWGDMMKEAVQSSLEAEMKRIFFGTHPNP